MTDNSKTHITNHSLSLWNYQQLQRGRAPWTKKEDDFILEGHAAGKDFSEIASKLPGRTTGQVRDRFNNEINPDLNKTPLSEQEKQTVYKLQQKYGNKWTMIAQRLPGRSENQIKNCWHNAKMTQRRLLRRMAKDGNPK